MNVPATDYDIPMPHIVSNSPTHSLPNVSYSGADLASVQPARDRPDDLAVGGVPEMRTPAPPGEHKRTALEDEDAVSASPPFLQRAISTGPRLERASDITRTPEGASGFGPENDLLFFPLVDRGGSLIKLQTGGLAH